MVAVGSSFFIVPDRQPVSGRPDPEVVVWLRGQHDASTESALCLTLARAIVFGGPGLVLDLSEVGVMRLVDARGHRPGRVSPATVSVVDGPVAHRPCPAPRRRLRPERPPGRRVRRSGRRGIESARSLGARTHGRAIRPTPQSARPGP